MYFHKPYEDDKMYLLVPAHLGCPGQSPESGKMVVCCMYVMKYWHLFHA